LHSTLIDGQDRRVVREITMHNNLQQGTKQVPKDLHWNYLINKDTCWQIRVLKWLGCYPGKSRGSLL